MNFRLFFCKSEIYFDSVSLLFLRMEPFWQQEIEKQEKFFHYLRTKSEEKREKIRRQTEIKDFMQKMDAFTQRMTNFNHRYLKWHLLPS